MGFPYRACTPPRGRLGIVLIGMLRLYEMFTDGRRTASELERLWSRVAICELLPGLTEYEARQMVQKALGRLPELTVKQILQRAGNSVRRLIRLLERLKELTEINSDRGLADLIPVASESTLVPTR